MDAPLACQRCGKPIEEEDGYQHLGGLYCEDCYMDILSPPKACDPWAVYAARSTLQGQDKLSALTPLQRRIVDYVRGKGAATADEIMQELGFSEQEFKREFAVLRHMEVLRGTKKETGIVYMLFGS
jgi:hypothetical protein